MYVKYSWKAAATRANILNDIIKLICGAGDTSTLSTDCDTGNTVWKANTLASNWTVFDAAAAADAQVVRSLNADGVTYKYMRVQLTAGGVLNIDAYESWNAATHVGANIATGYNRSTAGFYSESFTITTNGSINIITGPRYVFISNNYVLSHIPCGLMEFARETPTVGPAYPCHAIWGPQNTGPNFPTTTPYGSTVTSSSWGVSRIVDPVNNNTDLVNSSLTYTIVNGLGLGNNAGTPGTQYSNGTRASDNSRFLIALPIILQGCQTGGTNQLIHLGKIQGGVKYMPPNIPSFLIGDEVSVGGVDYVMFPAYAYSSVGAILIPKA